MGKSICYLDKRKWPISKEWEGSHLRFRNLCVLFWSIPQKRSLHHCNSPVHSVVSNRKKQPLDNTTRFCVSNQSKHRFPLDRHLNRSRSISSLHTPILSFAYMIDMFGEKWTQSIKSSDILFDIILIFLKQNSRWDRKGTTRDVPKDRFVPRVDYTNGEKHRVPIER